MQPNYRSFITHKLTESESDCQDSLYVPTESTAPPRLFAVADGATASFFSRLWAQELTKQFAEKPEMALKKETWAEWLEAAHSQWRAGVETIMNGPNASFLTVNGFHSRAVAASTFVGLRLSEPDGGRWPWQAVVHGDSCLFHLRASRMKPYGPKSVEDFGYLVDAVKSYPKEHPSEPECFTGSGDGEDAAAVEGDIFILATDALAQWLTRRAENGKPVWSAVLGLNSQAGFEKLVEQARTEANDAMVNDDVAVVVITFGAKTHAIYLESRYEPEPKPAKIVTPPMPPPKPVEEPKPQQPLPPPQPPKRPEIPPPVLPGIKPRKITRKKVLLGLQIAAVGATTIFGFLWRMELAERKRLGGEKESLSLRPTEADIAIERKIADNLRKELETTRQDRDQAKRDLANNRRNSTAAHWSNFDELHEFLKQKAKGNSETAKDAIRLFEKAKKAVSNPAEEFGNELKAEHLPSLVKEPPIGSTPLMPEIEQTGADQDIVRKTTDIGFTAFTHFIWMVNQSPPASPQGDSNLAAPPKD